MLLSSNRKTRAISLFVRIIKYCTEIGFEQADVDKMLFVCSSGIHETSSFSSMVSSFLHLRIGGSNSIICCHPAEFGTLCYRKTGYETAY